MQEWDVCCDIAHFKLPQRISGSITYGESDLCQDLPSLSQRSKPHVASTTLVAFSFVSNKGDKEWEQIRKKRDPTERDFIA